MAENKSELKPPAAQRSSDDQTFPVAALIGRSREYLGMSSHVVAGGLYGSAEKELSLPVARQRITDWLSRKLDEQEA